MPDPLPSLDAVLAQTARILEDSGTRFALIGAVAVAARGYVRTTTDVDFLVHAERVRIPGLLDRLRDSGYSFDPEPTLRALSEREVARVRFEDVDVDFVPAVLPYFQEILRRATPELIAGARVPVASVEDLLVLKLLAYRMQDRADIEGLAAASGGSVDVEYVRRNAAALLPDDDPRVQEFLSRFTP